MSWRPPGSTKAGCNVVLIGCLPNQLFQFMREYLFHLSKKKIKKETNKQQQQKDYPLHHSHKGQTMHQLMTFFRPRFVSDVLALHLARAHPEFHSQSFLQTALSDKIDGEECPIVGQN